MSHTQRSWLDRITFPLPHSARSPVRPPNRSVSCIPQHGVPCGRLAEQSQVKGYEPTVLSRSAAEKSRHWFDLQLWRGHRYDPCFVGSGWKTQYGIAGLTCVNKGERNAAPLRIYHSNTENSESLSSPVPTRTGRPAAMYSHKRKSSRDAHA